MTMGITESVEAILCSWSQFVWYIAFLVLIPLAIYLTIKYKGLQVRKLPESTKLAFDNDSSKDSESMSSFEAFMMGLGERIGIGNIISIAAAIMVGGPGAIFWMWIFAIIVAILSFAETTVSQVYKTKGEDGRFNGGPAYNMDKGYGCRKGGIAIAILFVAFIFIICCMLGSLFTQQYKSIIVHENSNLAVAMGIGIVLILVLILSNKAVVRANTIIVPVMAIGWIILCIATIIANWSNLGNAFAMIFHYAFVIPDELTQCGFLSIEGVWEGIKGPVGALLGTVMITGLRRGVFSNESGVGTVSILSSMANVKHPVKQGYVQATGVFIDTIVVCTCTALVILTYGNFSEIYGLGLNYTQLVTEIMSQSLLGDAAKYIVTIFLAVFTATTLISMMNMIDSTMTIFGKDIAVTKVVKYVLVILIILSCFSDPDIQMYMVDLMMAICSIVNICIIFGRRKVLRETYDDYVRQKDAGIDEPVFHRDALSDSTGVTEWK